MRLALVTSIHSNGMFNQDVIETQRRPCEAVARHRITTIERRRLVKSRESLPTIDRAIIPSDKNTTFPITISQLKIYDAIRSETAETDQRE